MRKRKKQPQIHTYVQKYIMYTALGAFFTPSKSTVKCVFQMRRVSKMHSMYAHFLSIKITYNYLFTLRKVLRTKIFKRFFFLFLFLTIFKLLFRHY